MKNIEIKNPDEEIVQLFSHKEWRQRIHLKDDIFTPGTRCDYEWDMCHLPDSLSRQSFIDVGANDGMFSFLAESKGASSVNSVDLYVDEKETGLNMTNGWSISRISTIKRIKRSNIQIQPCSIYNVSSLNKQFDVTYCGNVIAWLQDPILAISQLSSITKKKLIIREDISKVKGKPVLEYVNNQELTGCMFNGNEEFYRTYLQANGFKKINIIPLDEYKIFERRSKDFKKHTIPEGTKIYKNPFSDLEFYHAEKPANASSSSLINGKYFFNNYGWVNEKDVKPLPEAIPKNPLKKMNFERKFRKNMLHNCMIFAER